MFSKIGRILWSLRPSNSRGIYRPRVVHHLFALLGCVCFTLATILLDKHHFIVLPSSQTYFLLAVFWLVNLSFSLMFFTQLDETFKDEQLVFPHMLWGQFGLLVLAYYAPEMYQLSMLYSLATYVFVSFGLSSLPLFISVWAVAYGFWYIIESVVPGGPSAFHHITLMAYTIAALFIVAINSYVGNLQLYLTNQNELIQNRTRELENTQSQLIDARDAAEQAASSKTRFLAAASHDLRQPLHALELYIGALPKQTSDTSRAHIFAQMEKSANELGSLLSQLFDISKFDANVVDINMTTISIQEIIEGLALEFHDLSETLSRPLKIRKCDARVMSDVILCRRILRGLVTNALRHAQKGRVLVGFRTRNDKIRCEVWDSGQGIEDSDQAKIFEEFYQVKNGNVNRQNGLGLGLALVSRMCQSLDHDFGMRSKPGKGSVFWFEMSRSNEPLKSLSNKSEKPPLKTLRGKTIVCIDDEEAILDSLGFLLKGWGALAITADNPQTVINMVKFGNKKVDLILCDYRMPGSLNGIEVIEQLKQALGNEIPAMLITGDIDPGIKTSAEQKKISILQKPLNTEALQSNLIRRLSA